MGRYSAAATALVLILTLVLAGFLPIVLLGIGTPLSGDSYLLRVTLFTLLQAGLSTFLSIALALPVARALARQSFPGRGLIVKLFGLPLALPAIVAVLGLTGIYGAHGLLGGIIPLYGFTGILLAHVFFNFPMAARMILTAYDAIPPEHFRLAAQLDFSGRALWRLVEWPHLRTALPGIAILIFLLCTASFTVVLTLGGGPQATTLEVAIYQALRFDFDPQRAVTLALIQLVICTILALLTQRFGMTLAASSSLRLEITRYDGRSIRSRMIDILFIAMALLIFLPPLLAIVVDGLMTFHVSTLLLRAVATSLALGISSAIIATLLGWPLAQAAARGALWPRLSSVASLAALMLPPAVLATGWFVLLVRSGIAVPPSVLVVAMSSLAALPFVYTTLAPAVAVEAARYDRLCASLGISGFARFRHIDVPALKKPLGLAFIMAAVVSLGDLTAILLLGSQDLVTLPALIYRQMGSYRSADAAGTALVLAAFVLGLVALADRWRVARD